VRQRAALNFGADLFFGYQTAGDFQMTFLAAWRLCLTRKCMESAADLS